VRRTKVSGRTTNLSVGHGSNASGARLVQAADKLADGIREAAKAIPSSKIPDSVDVRPAGDSLVFVVAIAPNAYPIETGARHPLFGLSGNAKDRRLKEGVEFAVLKHAGRSRVFTGKGKSKKELVGHWYPMKQTRFMEQGVARSVDDAAGVYGETVEDWLHEVGWT
jgi:F0F1-type ATP synthase beta subunit